METANAPISVHFQDIVTCLFFSNQDWGLVMLFDIFVDTS